MGGSTKHPRGRRVGRQEARQFDLAIHPFPKGCVINVEEESQSIAQLKTLPDILIEDIKLSVANYVTSPTRDSLRCAIHLLRANIHSLELREGMSLVLRCVLGAFEGMKTSWRELTEGKSTEVEVAGYCVLCMGAYEASRHLWGNESCVWEDMLICDGDKNDCLTPQDHEIRIRIGLCTSAAFLYLSLLSLHCERCGKRSVTIPNEFHFVRDVISSCCNGGTTFHSIGIKAVFPLIKDFGREEENKLVEKLFRLYYSGARSLETCDNDAHTYVLHLRCLAVTILARFCVESFPSSNEEDRKELLSLFEKASSSALRAVVVFDEAFANSDSEEMRNELLEFHDVSGTMLDNVWIQFYYHEMKNCLPKYSYFEYCAYRYIHQWRLLHRVFSIHTPDQLLCDKEIEFDSQDGKSLPVMASLSVVLVALEACAALACPGKAYSTDINAVISNFEHVVICNASCRTQSRCLSIVTMLNLQRQLPKVVHASSTLGYVLGRCIAPLEARLASTCDDQQRRWNLRLLASVNHANAASFLNAAGKDSSVLNAVRMKWIAECESQMREAFDILSPIVDGLENCHHVASAVESFAKTAASIARNSFDEKIFATDLLARIACKGSNHDAFDKYQIFNQFLRLASALEINEDIEGTCASLALAVWGAAKKKSHAFIDVPRDNSLSIRDAASNEILLFPAAALFDIQSHSKTVTAVDELADMINDLTRACIKQLRSRSNKKKNIPPGTTLSTLVKNSFSETILISKLLDFILWGIAAFGTAHTVELLREIVKCMAKVLKNFVKTDAGNDRYEIYLTVMKELDEFICLQLKRLKNLVPPQDLLVISLAIRVSLAMYSIDLQMLRFPKLQANRVHDAVKIHSQSIMIRSSLDQLLQVEMKFVNATKESDCFDPCFFVQQAAVLLHLAIVSEHQWSCQQIEKGHDSTCDHAEYLPMQRYTRVLNVCNQAISQLVSTDEDAPLKVVESLIATLKRLLCRFGLHGDPVSSSQCFLHLQNLYSRGTKSQHMFDAVSDFLWVASKFDDLARFFFRNCIFDWKEAATSLLFEGVQQLNQDVEIDLVPNCIVDIMVATSHQLHGTQTQNISPTGEQSLRNIAQFIESSLVGMEIVRSDDEIDFIAKRARSEAIVQIQFFVISTLMLRSKMFLNARQPENSIKCLNACFIECKRMISLQRLVSGHLLCNHLLGDNLVQVDDFQSMVLERFSVAFSSLGLRRKAEYYAILAVKKQMFIPIGIMSMGEITFQHLMGNLERLNGMYNFLPPIRTIIIIKSLSLSPDKFDKLIFNTPSHRSSINGAVNASRTLLTYDDCFRHVPYYERQCDGFISLAQQSIFGLANQLGSDTSTDVLIPLVSPIRAEIKLRSIWRHHDKSDTPDILSSIVKSHDATPNCLVDAYFKLGLEALDKARSTNELYHLWKDHAVFPGKNQGQEVVDCDSSLLHTLQARKYFNCALLHANPASAYTTKNILRCLALVTGPEVLSAFLIHASVGGAARNVIRDAIVSNSFFSQEPNSSCRLYSIFNLFDDETSDMKARHEYFKTLTSEYASIIPTRWTISALATCPTGEILITSFRAPKEGEPATKTACIFTRSNDDERKHVNFYDSILSPFDRLIEKSQKQLRDINDEILSKQLNSKSSRIRLWNERISIEKNVQSLLQNAEDTYFGNDLVRRMLLSRCTDMNLSPSDENSREGSFNGTRDLASRFGVAERKRLQDFDEKSARSSIGNLNVCQLQEKLLSLGIKLNREKKKSDLIELLVSEMEKAFQTTQESTENYTDMVDNIPDTLKRDHSDEPYTVLILDEHLHRFPFESMDMFRDIAVSRMPSLPFVIAALHKDNSRGSNPITYVDPNKISFIIDPEHDFPETTQKMINAVESITSINGWKWKGCVGAGKDVTRDFMGSSLTEQNGLVLFCGHGGGETFFSRARVEELIKYYSDDKSKRRCCSAVLLMGCSSGRLKSVNSPKNNPHGSVYPMNYEPEGIALSYIFAGAPCVVGTLWDVTDIEIDKYCVALLENFFRQSNKGSSAPTLAKCVASARRACTSFPFIVGGSPVCYGMPLLCRKITS